jgi:daunorubicin resistance protein C
VTDNDPASDEGVVPVVPRRPRHRGDDDSARSQQWWRSDQAPLRRRARTDDEPTTKFARLERTAPNRDRSADAAITGSTRALVGPWTLLSPGAAAADWTAEQTISRLDSADIATGGRRGQLTKFTDLSSLDVTHVSAELQQAQTVRLNVSAIAAKAEQAAEESTPGDRRALATEFPDHADSKEQGVAAYLHHTRILSGRQLLVVTRDRLTLMQSLLFPLLSMVMFKVVLGDAVGQATGQNSAYGTVPLVVLVGAMFGSLAVGTRLISERRTGLLTRLYVLPVHRGADLSSRISVEMIRILVGTAVLTTAGMLIGWRFDQGVLPAIGIFGVALLYGAAYSTIVLTLAVSASSLPLVPIMSLVTSLLMFFNSGFSPIDAYPEVLQPLVRNQPMTCAIETMRALATGGPVAESLTKTVIWALGAILIFTYPALRGYRRAAASRT